jgi:hypothetical protein
MVQRLIRTVALLLVLLMLGRTCVHAVMFSEQLARWSWAS